VAYVRDALALATHALFVVLAVVALATVAAVLLLPRHAASDAERVPSGADDAAEAAG
jgi:hypothetical protein